MLVAPVAGGDILDIVSPSACCECQAAIPPTLPRAKQDSTAAKRLQQRPKVVSDQLDLRAQRIEILKRARLTKALKQLERTAAPEAEDALRCAKAWDSTQLHLGDQAARSAQERDVKHKFQFSMHGALKLRSNRVL